MLNGVCTIPAFILTFLLMVSGHYAKADVIAGMDWLASQQNVVSGEFSTATGIAYPSQSTFHAIRALQAGSSSYDLVLARQYILQAGLEDTESLSYLIILGETTLGDGRNIVELLKARQNTNGGFGDYVGYDSNPYDSAWALAAFNATGEISDSTSQLIYYITQSQQANGSWVAESSLTTALLLTELQSWRARYSSILSVQTQAANFVAADLTEHSEVFYRAIGLKALSVTGFEVDKQNNIAQSVIEDQQANGSWGDDVYLTAAVLSGLYHHAEPTSGSSNGWVRGVVLNHKTGAPVAGALIVSDTIGQKVITDVSGEFLLTAAEPGVHNLNISFNGFTGLSKSVDFSGSTLDIGRLYLSPVLGTVVLQGRLYDGGSGLPIAGASIEIIGATTTTVMSDSEGAFIAADLAQGSYNIALSKNGYYPQNFQTVLSTDVQHFYDVGMLADTAVLTDNSVTYRGRIVNGETGEGISGASVSLAGQALVNTDSLGQFIILDVTPERHELNVEADGYKVRTATVHVPPGGSGYAGDIKLYPVSVFSAPISLTLDFEVLDAATAQPVVGAKILLVDTLLQNPITIKNTTTTTDGRAEITGLDSLQHKVQVTAQGYKNAFIEIKASGFGTYSQRLFLTPSVGEGSRIFGTVKSEQSQLPISAANVSYAGSFNLPGPAISDSNGFYQFTDLNSGSGTIKFNASGYRTQVSFLEILTSQGLNIEYSPSLTTGVKPATGVKGVVTDWLTKSPMANVVVNFVGDSYSGSMTTDADGSFFIDNLVDAEISLTIGYRDYDTQEKLIGLTTNAITDLRNIRLIPTGHEFSYQLNGRVVDSTTLQPLPSVEVRYVYGELSGVVYTEDDGSFSITSLKEATGRVALFKDGYIDSAFSVGLQPDEITNFGDFFLRPGSGYILQSDFKIANVWVDKVMADATTSEVTGDVHAILINQGYRYSSEIPIQIVAFYDVDNNGLFDDGSDTILGSTAFSQLLPREEELAVVVPVNGVLPFRGAPISVAVDTTNVIDEQDETNNTAVSSDSCSAVETDFSTRRKLTQWSVLALPNNNGHGGKPTWYKSDDDYLVRTVSNAPQSGFLAGENISGTFAWSMEVRTGGDDDGQGFIWGLQDNKNYYYFGWDQGNCRCARLVTIVANRWKKESSVRNYEVPWRDNTKYYGFLDYQPGRSRVIIQQASDGKVIEEFVINDDTYTAGDFGFWNHSQPAGYFELFESQRVSTSDLSVGKLVVEEASPGLFTLSAQVGNGGSVVTPKGSLLSFYLGDPDNGGTLLAESDISALNKGESRQMSIDNLSGITDGDKIFAVVDHQKVVNECHENNNQQQLIWTEPLVGLTVSVSNNTLAIGETQLITATINSQSTSPHDLTLQWSLIDANGAVVILPATIINQLPAAGEVIEQIDWLAVEGVPAGNYVVQARLEANDGSVISVANSYYSVTVDIVSNIAGDGSEGAYGVDVDTDKLIYQQWDSVTLDSRVLNQTTNRAQTPSLAKVSVVSPAGVTVLVKEYVVDSLFPGTFEAHQHRLALADSEQGKFEVLIELFSADGSEKLAENRSYFEVVASNNSGISAAITVTNTTPYIGDPLVCNASATNQSDNNNYAGTLTFKVMNADDGEVLVTISQPAALAANGLWTDTFDVDTTQLPMGNYVCSVSVGSGADEKLMSFAGFRLLSQPVSLSAEVALAEQGFLLALVDAPKACTPLNSVSVDMKLMHRWFGYHKKTVDIDIFNASGILLFSDKIIGGHSKHLVSGDLSAALSLSNSGRLQAKFSTITGTLADGYRIEAKLNHRFFSNHRRWNIRTDCERSLKTYHWRDGYRLLSYQQDENTVDVDDRDPNGPAHGPLLAEQKRVLAAILEASGWSYKLVDDADEFRKELRSGIYNGYALLAEKIPLDVWTLKHLRETVNAGAGLFVAGQHDMRVLALSPALGVYPLGRHQQTTGIAASNEQLGLGWSEQWQFNDHAISLGLRGASVLAEYSLMGSDDSGYSHWYGQHTQDQLTQLLNADDDEEHDDNAWHYPYRHCDAYCVGSNGRHRGNGSWLNYYASCGRDWRAVKSTAVTFNNYGKGRAVTAGFDWLMQATAAGEQSGLADGLKTIFHLIRPGSDEAVPQGSSALTISVANDAMATPGRVQLMLENTQLLTTNDFIQAGNSWQWNFEIQQGEQLIQKVQIRTPATGEAAKVIALVQAGEDSSWIDQATSMLSVEGMRSPHGFEQALAETQRLIDAVGPLPRLIAVKHKLLYAQSKAEAAYWRKAYHSLLLSTSILSFTQDTADDALRLMIDDIVRDVATHIN